VSTEAAADLQLQLNNAPKRVVLRGVEQAAELYGSNTVQFEQGNVRQRSAVCVDRMGSKVVVRVRKNSALELWSFVLEFRQQVSLPYLMVGVFWIPLGRASFLQVRAIYITPKYMYTTMFIDNPAPI
jgi:hypothetical protein